MSLYYRYETQYRMSYKLREEFGEPRCSQLKMLWSNIGDST